MLSKAEGQAVLSRNNEARWCFPRSYPLGQLFTVALRQKRIKLYDPNKVLLRFLTPLKHWQLFPFQQTSGSLHARFKEQIPQNEKYKSRTD